MTFDISPMQSTASPIALLAGLQGTTASDDFAALLDRGPLPEKVGEQSPFVDSKPATAAPVDLPPVSDATPAPAAAALAIAQADALVATLAPAPEHTETPSEPKVSAPIPIALPIAARPCARRGARASRPDEAPDRDRPVGGAVPDRCERSEPPEPPRGGARRPGRTRGPPGPRGQQPAGRDRRSGAGTTGRG